MKRPSSEPSKQKNNTDFLTHCLTYSPNWDTPSTITYHSPYLAYAVNSTIFILHLCAQSPVAQINEVRRQSALERVKALSYFKEFLVVARQVMMLDMLKGDKVVDHLVLEEVPDTFMKCKDEVLLCSTVGNSVYGIKVEKDKLKIIFKTTIGFVAKRASILKDEYVVITGINQIWIFNYMTGKKQQQIQNKVHNIQDLTSFKHKDNYWICATTKDRLLKLWKLDITTSFTIKENLEVSLMPISTTTKSIIKNIYTPIIHFNTPDAITLVYGTKSGVLNKITIDRDITKEILEEEVKKESNLLVGGPHKADVFWLKSLGEKAISVSFEGAIAIWDMSTESKEWHFTCLRSSVKALARSSGKVLLGLHGNIKIWNLSTSNKYQVLDVYKSLKGDIIRIFISNDEGLVGLIERNERKELNCVIYNLYEEASIQRIKCDSVIYAGWIYKKEEEQYLIITEQLKVSMFSINNHIPVYTIQLALAHFIGSVKEFKVTACVIIEISKLLSLPSAFLVIMGYNTELISFWIVMEGVQYHLLAYQDITSKVDYLVVNAKEVSNRTELFTNECQIAVVSDNTVNLISITKLLLQLNLLSTKGLELAENIKVQKWRGYVENVDMLKGHEKPITCISYVEGDNLIVTGSQDKSVQIWNTSAKHTGTRAIHNIRGHTGYITSALCFRENAKLVCVTASEDQTCKVWDLEAMLNEAPILKPPKTKVRKEKNKVLTLFPRIQQLILTQQINKDCEETINLLGTLNEASITYENICTNIDFYLFSASLNKTHKKAITILCLKYELDQIKYYEKFEYLHRALILNILILIASKDYRVKDNILQLIYNNYHLVKDKTNDTNELTLVYIALILNIEDPKKFLEFIGRLKDINIDLHTSVIIHLANSKPLEEAFMLYMENNLLLDALIVSLLFEEENSLVLEVLNTMKCKLENDKPVQSKKIEKVLSLIKSHS